MNETIAVIGPGEAAADLAALAYDVGGGVARLPATLVCGGLGGVMAAACRGAKDAGGLTVGLLPGTDRAAANRWVDVAVPTGLGEARNVLVVRMAAVVIAVGGSWGTLTEVALACRAGTPVVGLRAWSVRADDGSAVAGIQRVSTAGEAVQAAARLLRRTT